MKTEQEVNKAFDGLAFVRDDEMIRKGFYGGQAHWLDYPGKLRIAKDIAIAISKGMNVLCLFAMFQWGKTTIVEILAHLYRGKRRVVYACSYDRLNFRRQVINDLRKYEHVLVLTPREYNNYALRLIKDDDIIILDECHYGCKAGQNFDKYLSRVQAKYPNITKLYVSATPFDYLAVTKDQTLNLDEHVFYPTRQELKDAGYYGFWEMMEKGLLVEDASLDALIRSLKKGQYGIVRFSKNLYSGANSFDQLVNILRAKHGPKAVEIIPYTQEHKFDDFEKETGRDAETARVYVVKHNLRQGERINLKNLGFTYEEPSKIMDTSTQSLEGRGCGNGVTSNAIHRGNVKAAKEYMKTWEKLWAGDRDFLSKEMRLSFGTDLSSERTDQAVYQMPGKVWIAKSHDELPNECKPYIVYGAPMGHCDPKKIRPEKTYRVKSISASPVLSKGYHGQGRMSDENLKEVHAAMVALASGKPYNLAKFSRAGNTEFRTKTLRYGLFFIETDELTNIGLPNGSVIVVEKIDDLRKVTTKGRVAENTFYERMKYENHVQG